LLNNSDFVVALAVGGGGSIGAFVDLRTRRVPNPLTMGIAAVGVGLAAAQLTGLSVIDALLGFTVGLVFMLPGFLIGATGGGDVKFFAALGTLLGPRTIGFAFLYAVVAGGLLAVAVAVHRRRLFETLVQTRALVATGGRNVDQIEHPSRNNRFAYAPAIAIGSMVAALKW
jgi:prepilin peptidase CpaA